MLRLGFVVAVLGLSGCFFSFTDDDGDDCLLPAATNAELAPAPLRDPGNLTCQSFGGGCNPECGPCPETARGVPEPTPPIPSWNYCGHRCESLTEGACSTDPECRVVKDARCGVWMDCETDFIGCYPTDTVPDASIACEQTYDAWECSRSSECTAYHFQTGGRTSPQQSIEFAMCVSEGQSPGMCWSPVACDAAPPRCPTGTTPGVENGCYTNACIPLDACEPRPNE